MPEEAKDAETVGIPISLKLEHVFPEDLKTYFVETATSQFLPDHFILSFFEVFPTTLVEGSMDEQAGILNAMQSIQAKCVSRIVVTPAKMREIVQIFTMNLEQYERVIKQRQE
jgi:Protein of unknown function (DUF3467)